MAISNNGKLNPLAVASIIAIAAVGMTVYMAWTEAERTLPTEVRDRAAWKDSMHDRIEAKRDELFGKIENSILSR